MSLNKSRETRDHGSPLPLAQKVNHLLQQTWEDVMALAGKKTGDA
jgi:hypothetical protein